MRNGCGVQTWRTVYAGSFVHYGWPTFKAGTIKTRGLQSRIQFKLPNTTVMED